MKKSKAITLLHESLEVLSNIEKAPFDEQNFYFKGNLPASKALRIILYKLYLNILYCREKLLKSHEEEDLHQFRVNIRKSRAFIKTFGFLFQNGLDNLLLTRLSKIAAYTNKKRDLDVIKVQLEKNVEPESGLTRDIKVQSNEEKEKIDTMLESSELTDFLIYYKKVLSEGEHLFVSHKEDEKVKKSAKKAILKLQKNIQKRIKKLEKKFSVEKLHKIRIAFKKLRYLLEEFQHLYDAKHIASDIKHMKDLQTLLGDFNDTINQKNLISAYLDSSNISKNNISHDALLKDMSKKEQALLKNVLEALHAYKNKTLMF